MFEGAERALKEKHGVKISCSTLKRIVLVHCNCNCTRMGTMGKEGAEAYRGQMEMHQVCLVLVRKKYQ